MGVKLRQEGFFQTPKKIIDKRHSNEDIEIQDSATVIQETISSSPTSTMHVDENDIIRKKVLEKTINLGRQEIISDSDEDDSSSSIVLDEDRAVLRNINESASVEGPTDVVLEPQTPDASKSEGRERPISELVDALAANKSYCFREPGYPASQSSQSQRPFVMDFPPPTESLCNFVAQVLGDMENPSNESASSGENGQSDSHCLNCEGLKGVVERIEKVEATLKVICERVDYLTMHGVSLNSPMRPVADERPSCSSNQMSNYADKTIYLSDKEENFEGLNSNQSTLLVSDDEWSVSNSLIIQSPKKRGRGRPRKIISTDSFNKSKQINKRRGRSRKSKEVGDSDNCPHLSPQPKKVKIAKVSKKVFACNKCPKSYKHKRTLDAHKLTHESPFKCEICGTNYASQYRYKRHLKTQMHKNNERKMANAS